MEIGFWVFSKFELVSLSFWFIHTETEMFIFSTESFQVKAEFRVIGMKDKILMWFLSQFTGNRREKGGCHQIIRSFLLPSTVVFCGPLLDWGWQMSCVWNQVLVNQEEVRNILIIEQGSQYSTIWKCNTSVIIYVYRLIKDNSFGHCV